MRKVSRYIYHLTVWLFIVGVVTQVFLAGMVVVAGQMGWDNHIGLGHVLGFPLAIMLVTVYSGRFPGRMKRLTWLLLAVYIIQADVIIFLRADAPIVSAFHPVLALADFGLGLTLAMKARSLVRQNESARVSMAAGARLDTVSTD